MATFRRVSPASSALTVREFAHYNDALAYTRSMGANRRPLRTVTPTGLVWRVPIVNVEGIKPGGFVKLPHWEKPFRTYCEPHSVAAHLTHLDA